MSRVLQELFSDEIPCHLHPFTGLSSKDTKESIEEKVCLLKSAGISSLNILWNDPGHEGPVSVFNSGTYWEHIGWVAEVCRAHAMTFMIQDAAPFPTGEADGWLEKEEYRQYRKLYLAERHLDLRGPLKGGKFRIDLLTGANRRGDVFDRPFEERCADEQLTAVIAMKRENGCFRSETARDLTEEVQDGILFWNVPDGIWRIFVIYETYNGSGRKGYMNLLDAGSVALEIKAVYEPHYEHLKNEAGRTWIGMFYDETEVGNLESYGFTTRIGTPQDLGGNSQELPWSHALASRWKAERGERYRLDLPLLWFCDRSRYRTVRYHFMDLCSRLIRDNYNRQVYTWCRDHGLQYIGHNLEDENSHCRLACGPVHFFRMQTYQDMAGVDMIGNQMFPGKDYTQAWYGCGEGDGEFYHYGLAKLASSAGHIAPDKQGRSFCEVFAVYGALAGTRIRKCILDHLFVNGITELIPADPVFKHLAIDYSRELNTYANRMCHLLTVTKPVIKTAVLYHAAAEWYGGEYQYFQKPAAELARHQISYDVIPQDVFSDTEFYRTDTEKGLTVNGNVYDALIIPMAEAIPAFAAAFIACAEKNHFPVFYTDRKPQVIAETGEPFRIPYGMTVPLSDLASEVRKAIAADIRLEQETPDLRYAHYEEDGSHYYLLQNQGGKQQITVHVPYAGPVIRLDLLHSAAEAIEAGTARENEIPDGTKADTVIDMVMDRYESVILVFGNSGIKTEPAAGNSCQEQPLKADWTIRLRDLPDQEIRTRELYDIAGKDHDPRYTGRIIYETNVVWDRIPEELDLGAVYEAAEVSVNGRSAGSAMCSPYRFRIRKLARIGENRIHIEVIPNPAAAPAGEGAEKLFASMGAAAYCPLDPAGMLGPVQAVFREEHRDGTGQHRLNNIFSWRF